MDTMPHATRTMSSPMFQPVPLPSPPPPWPSDVEIAPQQVWASLPPPMQTQIRRTSLQILQEVLHHAQR